MSLTEAHERRMLLDLLSPSGETDESVSPEGDSLVKTIGPWSIRTEADGTVSWELRSDLSVREKHSWKLQNLSTRRRTSRTTRVLLLGESAAGSYGYWGNFTLATTLERKLSAACPGEAFEVIDLSCINAVWSQCLKTLRHALSLRPDLAVIYCGNNEAKMIIRRLNKGELRRHPSAFAARWGFQADDPRAYHELLNRCLEEHIHNLVRESVRLSRHFEIDIVFVVPEYNLKDWQGPERLPFHLKGEKLAHWDDLNRRGEAALIEQHFIESRDFFQRAIELDGELCQRSQRGLAQALLALGDTTAAAEAFIRARDAGLGPFVRGIPQVTEGVISVMRQAFNELSVPYVDLPQLMRAQAPDGIPDRSLFLDYCHLNAAGHNLLADALTKRIFQETGKGRTLEVSGPLNVECQPGATEESLASMVAAIHNYHHGQTLEITGYWLRRSLAQWEGAEPLLRFLRDNICSFWRERYTVEWFRQQGLLDLVGEKYFFFYAKYFYHARFDHDLADLISTVLESDEHEAARSLWQQTESMLTGFKGSLHSLFFLDRQKGFTPSGRTAPRGGWERSALQIDATDFTSVAEFPMDNDQAATLELEFSGIDGAPRLSCALRLNGVEGERFVVRPGWQQRRIKIPEGRLRKGMNCISFCWSALTTLTDHSEAYERQRFIERYGFYPVAARIHKMRLVTE